MEGQWSCYRGGHYWRENGHVTEVVTNIGRMVMSQAESLMKEDGFEAACLMEGIGHVREVASLMEGTFMLRRWPV